MDDNDGIEEAFKGFGEDEAPTQPPADDNNTPDPQDDPDGGDKKDDDKETPDADKSNTPDDKPESPAKSDKEEPTSDSSDKPDGEEKQPDSGDKDAPADKPEPGRAPDAPEPPSDTPPAPLTKEDVQSAIRDYQNDERTSARELDTAVEDVMKAYYPEGLSDVLVDQNTGKELRTPQDVVDASNGEMTTEEATQWLMNEEFKLKRQVSEIRDNARKVAETTVNFKRDAETALQKYEPLFKWNPKLQGKIYEKLMKQVKADVDKGVILSAPDVLEFYDDYLEPYQQAFEQSTQQPGTNPTEPPKDDKPEPPKPDADDRLDDTGDGGTTPPNDPNDFAQQVGKELAKGEI